MGIFSDKDINDLDNIVKNESYRMEFLESFEGGFNRMEASKSTDEIDMPRGKTSLKRATRYWGIAFKDYNAPSMNAKLFGFNFGMYIGLLKYHPLWILELHPSVMVNPLSCLRSYHPQFREYVETRYLEWAKKVKLQISQLNTTQTENYRAIVDNVN